jgi:hypothetical protein
VDLALESEGEQMSRPEMSSALALAVFFSLASWSTKAAAADYYGAIAFSQDSGNVGYSNDYRSREEAEERARAECGRECEVVLWFVNACGVLAVGDDNGYGTAWAASRREAEEIALSNCTDNATNCSVNRWVCTTR